MPLVISTPFLPIQEVVEATRSGSVDAEGPYDALDAALSTLFEFSPILSKELVPALVRRIQISDERNLPGSYSDLVDNAIEIVRSWPLDKQSAFVAGHPPIGEVKSALSAQEQGQSSTSISSTPTPPEVLSRLKVLNKAYERLYPGLVYITFVNGRSRAQIRDEMEEKIRGQVAFDGDEIKDVPHPHTSESDEWRNEVKRAVNDVGKIAHSRLSGLGWEQT